MSKALLSAVFFSVMALQISCSARNYNSDFIDAYYAAPGIVVYSPAINSVQSGSVEVICEAAALSGVSLVEVDAGNFSASYSNPEPGSNLTTNLIFSTNIVFTVSGPENILIRAWNRLNTVSETNVPIFIQGPVINVTSTIPSITADTNLVLTGTATSSGGSPSVPAVTVTAGAGFSASFAAAGLPGWSAAIVLFPNRVNTITVTSSDSAGITTVWSTNLICDQTPPVSSGSTFPAFTNVANAAQANITWRPADNIPSNVARTIVIQTGGTGVAARSWTNFTTNFSLPVPDVPLTRGGSVTDIVIVMDTVSNQAFFTNICNFYPALWVSPAGNDNAPGFADSPLLTLPNALELAASLGGITDIRAATGVYDSDDGSECILVQGTLLIEGSWDTAFSAQGNFTNQPTVIRGNSGILRAVSVAPGANLTLSSVIIDDAGSVTGAEGGGIRVSNASLTLDSVLITNCAADQGAGIFAANSIVNISNTAVILESGRSSILQMNGGSLQINDFCIGWNYLSPAASAADVLFLSGAAFTGTAGVFLTNTVRMGADLFTLSVGGGSFSLSESVVSGNGGFQSNVQIAFTSSPASCSLVSDTFAGSSTGYANIAVSEITSVTGQDLIGNTFSSSGFAVLYHDSANGDLNTSADLNNPAETGASAASTNNIVTP
jgi:hypothetical protein